MASSGYTRVTLAVVMVLENWRLLVGVEMPEMLHASVANTVVPGMGNVFSETLTVNEEACKDRHGQNRHPKTCATAAHLDMMNTRKHNPAHLLHDLGRGKGDTSVVVVDGGERPAELRKQHQLVRGADLRGHSRQWDCSSAVVNIVLQRVLRGDKDTTKRHKSQQHSRENEVQK